MMTRRHFSIRRLLVVGALSALVTPAAYADDPQNVVLILADDMDWTDLPFYSPAVHWEDPTASHLGETDETEEARIRTPDLNLSASRLLAGAGPTAALGLDPIGPMVDGPDADTLPNDVGVAIVPGDRANATSFTEAPAWDGTSGHTTCANPWKTAAAGCTANQDILKHHGGLKKLATNGVVMPRMYSASARCAPARAALFTGRSQTRVGVPNNHAELNARELTIAEFLKQGCRDDDPYACYRTALIGKWHLGDAGAYSKTGAFGQGFDEFFGFGGGSRNYSSTNPLKCSPVTVRFAPPSGAPNMAEAIHPRTSRFCQLNYDNAPACSATVSCPTPLVCGETSGKCFDPDLAPGLYDLTLNPNGDECNSETYDCDTHPVTAHPRTCQEHWLYVGKKQWDACPNAEAKNITCCARNAESPEDLSANPKGNDDGANPGTYSFNYKYHPGESKKIRFRFDGRNAPHPCNYDGSVLLDDENQKLVKYNADEDSATDVVSCAYSERLYAAAASNFIRREAPRVANTSGVDAQRFFLTVSLHAAHGAHKAPERTEAHYNTVIPKDPNKQYWGVIEELDAAVGRIVNALEVAGYCSSSGASCDVDVTPSSVCGTCNSANLASSTLVLFTNDNGAPNANYGMPLLRSGKESVWEGGTKVGLIAYGAKVGLCDDGTCNGDSGLGRVDSTQQRARVVTNLGSHVDLFPTIADAAGYDENHGSGNRIDVVSGDGKKLQTKVCDNAANRRTTVPCVTDADCADDPETGTDGTCSNVRGLDGRSLLEILQDTSTPGPVVADNFLDSDARTSVFSQYPASGYPSLAVVTDGTSASGVCGYERPADVPGGTSSVKSGRTISGSTALPCSFSGAAEYAVDDATCGDSDDDETIDADTSHCEMVGKYCLAGTRQSGDAHDCANGDRWDNLCLLKNLQRCTSEKDCGAGRSCVLIKIPCESNYVDTEAQQILDGGKCFAADFKGLGSKNGATTTDVSQIYEMRTNPEEQEDGSLDIDKDILDLETSAQFNTVETNLETILAAWKNCADAETFISNGSPATGDALSCDP